MQAWFVVVTDRVGVVDVEGVVVMGMAATVGLLNVRATSAQWLDSRLRPTENGVFTGLCLPKLGS